jgi:site-specific recombinase XerD
MRLEELANTFLNAQTNRLSANTRRAYGYDFGLLARAVPDLEAQDISVEHLRAFLNMSADLARSSLARRQAALRALFGWAYKNDFLPADPTHKLDPVKVKPREPRPLTNDQVEAILTVIPRDQKRNKLLFTLLAETGLRVGEALSLHDSDVRLDDLGGGSIRVIGKGDQERIVPLIDAPRTVRLLREALKASGVGPLFRGNPRKGGRSGEPLDYTTVLYHFEQYVSLAQAKRPDLFEEEKEPITIHRLRHTYATERLRDGVSLPSVRKLLGHKNIQTTMRYVETDLDTVKRELVEARRRKR